MTISAQPRHATYAWIITQDHLADTSANEAGIIGPRNAADRLIERLKNGEGDTFKMYDDDGILYYTGRALTLDGTWDEDACYGPLGDFGMPNAGAVLIEWPGHRDRDCG